MNKIPGLLLLFLICNSLHAQQSDSVVIRNIFTNILEQGVAYTRLDYLSNQIGPRLSGSENAEKAVKWAAESMTADSFATVYLQEVMVPHWVRNDKEVMVLHSKGKKIPLRMCSLGGSIGTPSKGIRAQVLEVGSFDELNALDRGATTGKIIFYNVPMQQRHINTFHAYGETGKYRWSGAMNASKTGAIASINRSLTLSLDDYPHTGSMGYNDTIKKIPGCAISTIGAETLSSALKADPDAELEIIMNCETLPDKLSHNVIAEIKGSEYPEEIIVLGGHLDAWDNGHGAHDDGAGCVQAMEVIRLFRDLQIQPKRTIRVVLFMNEENGLKGAAKYAEEAKAKNEKHIAAIESDAGGFTPKGFFYKCNDSTKYALVEKWKSLFDNYGMHEWMAEGGGADIDPLKDQGAFLFGLMPDNQRYFDYHHTEIDTFDKVNKRELHLGASAMAALVYLLSEYGVN